MPYFRKSAATAFLRELGDIFMQGFSADAAAASFSLMPDNTTPFFVKQRSTTTSASATPRPSILLYYHARTIATLSCYVHILSRISRPHLRWPPPHAAAAASRGRPPPPYDGQAGARARRAAWAQQSARGWVAHTYAEAAAATSRKLREGRSKPMPSRHIYYFARRYASP